MDSTFHPLAELFTQLGLASGPDEIAEFLRQRSPLPNDVALPDATFWTPSQAALLREALEADSDWSEPVDTADHAAALMLERAPCKVLAHYLPP